MATTHRLDHIVVLMMENRSFDHMLGFLPHENPAFGGLSGNESCLDQNGKAVVVSKQARYEIGSPDHSHSGALQQMFDGNQANEPTNRGFVKNYEKRSPGNGHKVMRCFDPRMLPVFSTLATGFAVCNRWFASVPGETWPNREFVHSGTSRGTVNIEKLKLFSGARTIFEQLDEAGASYRIYHDDTPHTWAYTSLWDSAKKRSRFQGIKKLYEAIANDALASYSFVEPDYGLIGWGNSQHPGQAHTRGEFAAGERLVHNIYNALRTHPDVFEKTLFLITYDEHGGFYDHVAPPKAAPDVAHANGFQFDRLGVRVPALVISPWIPRGTVDPTVYDHTSVIQTVRSRFAPGKALTGRDAVANVFRGLLTLNEPRRGAELPTTRELNNEDYAKLELAYAAPPDPAPLGVAAVDAAPTRDEFKDALRLLSDAVGAELEKDVGPIPSIAGGAPDPAAVLSRFRMSSEE